MDLARKEKKNKCAFTEIIIIIIYSHQYNNSIRTRILNISDSVIANLTRETILRNLPSHIIHTYITQKYYSLTISK